LLQRADESTTNLEAFMNSWSLNKPCFTSTPLDYCGHLNGEELTVFCNYFVMLFHGECCSNLFSITGLRGVKLTTT